jgi:hypothetical protein
VFLEGIKVEFHDLRQDFALALLFDAVDEFVENPGTGDELEIGLTLTPMSMEKMEKNIPWG